MRSPCFSTWFFNSGPLALAESQGGGASEGFNVPKVLRGGDPPYGLTQGRDQLLLVDELPQQRLFVPFW